MAGLFCVVQHVYYELLAVLLRFLYAVRPNIRYAAFLWSPRRDRRQEIV
jgi:hypothetical protein